jgi:hypothetical protein
MALPYNSLIESLEEEVKNGTFTAWAFANQEGMWCAFMPTKPVLPSG